MTALSAHLKSLRKTITVGEDSITQAEFGRRLGLAQTTISDIERGTNGVSAETLACWLDATNASAADRLEALRLAREPAPETAPLA
jgi:transcriptional regulator with XRE-family HTH domain